MGIRLRAGQMPHYVAIVEDAGPDKAIGIWFPELPGCFSAGDDVGLSIQGQDANNAWKAVYYIVKAIKVPVEVTFVWQDNPKAAAPGVVGKFVVAFD